MRKIAMIGNEKIDNFEVVKLDKNVKGALNRYNHINQIVSDINCLIITSDINTVDEAILVQMVYTKSMPILTVGNVGNKFLNEVRTKHFNNIEDVTAFICNNNNKAWSSLWIH